MNVEQPASLERYLAQRGYALEESRILTGGVSNNSVLVRLRDGSSIVVKQAREQLKSAAEWKSDPRRIRQEALAMEWLSRWTPTGSIPRLLFLDKANHILAMDAVPEPHHEWKRLLLSGRIDMDHFSKFGELLAAIHRGSYLERREVEPLFRDQSFFFSLRLEPYYFHAAKNEPRAAVFLRELVRETQARRVALVHGDYSPKNVLVRGDQLVLLDHEAANFGEPAFDAGFALTHFLSKALHLPEYRDRLRTGAREFWRAYCGCLPAIPEFADVSERVVRHTLGCLLARVAGKSLLEYLTPQERDRQRAIVLSCMEKVPANVENLIDEFIVLALEHERG
jgi:tRNA A-37 threonylcarbamoyl transferase component Bud32